MTHTPSFVIRDALPSDVVACLALEHQYESQYVWQMTIQPDHGAYQVYFRNERLPRTIDITYPADEMRLRLALPIENCYLVAESKTETSPLLGYLTLRSDPIHQIALIQDIVVSSPVRRKGIGTRLLKVARQWAYEQGAEQIMIETQTKNNPAIQFCLSNGFAFCGFNDQYFRNKDIAIFFGQALR